MYKLFITGEMTMEDFRKMCGKELNVPDTNVGDMISRQDAIKHLKKRLYETALNSNTEHPYYEEIADNRIEVWMNEVPSVEPTLYGYNVNHLIMIAEVLRKENMPPEKVVEVLTDIGRIVAIVRDEFEKSLREAVEQCMT